MRRDVRGATALEFALVFPAVILFLVAMIAVYTLIASNRAMDYGIEKALRYAAVHGGGGTANVTAAFRTAAGVVWRDVGVSAGVSVTPSTFKAGDTVTITITYNWAPPAGLRAPDDSDIFLASTLTTIGAVRVMN